MKFQNPSFKFFLNGRTNGWTDKRTDGRTDKPKAICSPLFQSWGHKNWGLQARGIHFFFIFALKHNCGCSLELPH